MLLPLLLLLATPAEAPDDIDALPPSAAPGPGSFSLDLVGAEQVVQVTTRDWRDEVARLTRFEKVGGVWMQVGPTIEVVVGENGLGWGLGLHPLGVGEPRKVEGDARAPAGVFRLLSAFGPMAPPMKTRMPWLRTSAELVCVDDPRGGAYNRLVDEHVATPATAPDAGVAVPPERSYRSAERMWRNDGLYEIGLLIDQNGFGDTSALVVPGRGSCAFVHVWKRKGRATQGCTAMARADLEKLVEWLDPAKKPVLVQLPLPELVKHRIPWRLP
ncbi:MAG: hypothetical protein IT383_18510 [Deltaproteobacteria bacterium]|nr:hypothetical protein [Deltaproteobacteria bacterium]